MSKNRKNVWIIVVVVVVILVAAVLVVFNLRGQNSSSQATYQTTTVQRGTLTATVEGSGTVASSQSANLAWQAAGQVDKVNVKIGDGVKADDILASLSASSLSPNILAAQLDLETARQNLNNLLHPDGATLAVAQVALASAYKSYNAVSSDLFSVLVRYQGNGDTALFDTLNMDRSIVITAYNALPLATADTKLQSYYWAMRALQMGQMDHDYSGIVSSLRSQIDSVNADKADALVTAQADYEAAVEAFAASLTDSGSATVVNSSLATYANTVAGLATAQEKMYTIIISPDPAQVASAQAKVDAAQATLNQAQITAPFDGTVTQVSNNPGDVVSAGTKAIRVDNLSTMIVIVQITEIDVNSVMVDQPATIVFDAIPNKVYNGKVIRADLAGTAGQNSVNFNVTVALTDADVLVKPGMAANVTIITNQVADALLVPSTAIFTDNTGQPYVYLIQNGSPTVVNITVGAVSSTTTQITSDNLKEGDTIVLSFASTTSSGGGRFGFGGPGAVTGGSRIENAQPSTDINP